MATKVGISGFGRIGRMVFRQMIFRDDLEVVAINASYPAETLAHMIKYDSIHGHFQGSVEVKDAKTLTVCNQEIHLVNERHPLNLPWVDLGVELVVEATGKFRSQETAGQHLTAGAKKVVITAPGDADGCTIVMGVNEKIYNGQKDHVISNASCTTNCLAPIAKILDEHFGIENGMMTTVHAFTNDQQALDNPHKDLRRARSCVASIIPTTTGAAKALGLVLPQLQGKLDGVSLRVPTQDVSLVDLTVNVRKNTTVEEVNEVFKEASQSDYFGIVDYCDEPLVSMDFKTDDHSTIIDGLSTMVMDGKQIKILAWYDNEWGYAARVVDLATYVMKQSA